MKLKDVGQSTKQQQKPPEEKLERCPRCGMERAGWTANDGLGFRYRMLVFCCEGCAKGTGCVCVNEAARHSGENIGQQRRSA